MSEVDVDAFASLAERAIASADYGVVSDVTIQRVLTAAVKLYAAKAEESGSYPPPLKAEEVTPTEIVTVVSEMMRAGGLNLFDLSMWFRRAR